MVCAATIFRTSISTYPGDRVSSPLASWSYTEDLQWLRFQHLQSFVTLTCRGHRVPEHFVCVFDWPALRHMHLSEIICYQGNQEFPLHRPGSYALQSGPESGAPEARVPEGVCVGVWGGGVRVGDSLFTRRILPQEGGTAEQQTCKYLKKNSHKLITVY